MAKPAVICLIGAQCPSSRKEPQLRAKTGARWIIGLLFVGPQLAVHLGYLIAEAVAAIQLNFSEEYRGLAGRLNGELAALTTKDLVHLLLLAFAFLLLCGIGLAAIHGRTRIILGICALAGWRILLFV
jgi:hypothetical protein